jgi:ABC-type phosphate transport system auxiliary subunit
MAGFEEWGKKLDDLMERIKDTTQEGTGKTVKEAGEWGKRLSQLGETVKKTTQEGIEKFATGTKELAQVSKLRSHVRELKTKMTDKFRQMGEETYKLFLKEGIEDEKIKKLGAEVTKLKKDIQTKEDQINKLRKRKEKQV